MEKTWKSQGIFELIQLSRHPIKLNPAMIGASLYFWNRTTNTLQIPYGMVGPTLFEVAAITGLRPTGEVILSNMSSAHKYRVNMSQTAYSAYIKNNMGMPGSAISDHEHVAFLLYWLNSIIFCSKNVKAQTTLLPLAALLHEGRKLCLSKLLLARLYEEISHVVELIKGGKNFNPGGPFWLLQLWLNAIFESLL